MVLEICQHGKDPNGILIRGAFSISIMQCWLESQGLLANMPFNGLPMNKPISGQDSDETYTRDIGLKYLIAGETGRCPRILASESL